VSPDTVQESGPLLHVHVLASGLEVTVYPVMADPPSEEGADQETLALALPASAETPVGAVGRVAAGSPKA